MLLEGLHHLDPGRGLIGGHGHRVHPQFRQGPGRVEAPETIRGQEAEAGGVDRQQDGRRSPALEQQPVPSGGLEGHAERTAAGGSGEDAGQGGFRRGSELARAGRSRTHHDPRHHGEDVARAERVGARFHAVVEELEAEALAAHARALSDAGRFREAIEAYSRAIALAPQSEYYRGRGTALSEIGQAQAALAAYGQRDRRYGGIKDDYGSPREDGVPPDRDTADDMPRSDGEETAGRGRQVGGQGRTLRLPALVFRAFKKTAKVSARRPDNTDEGLSAGNESVRSRDHRGINRRCPRGGGVELEVSS